MILSTIDPTTVQQMKFQLAGDLTATVAIVFTDGRLDVFTDIPVVEARDFQLKVSQNPVQQSSVPRETVDLDPAENEPGPPAADSPCPTCGFIHPKDGNPHCICVFCFTYKEIVHSGACADCARTRWGGYFEALGTPIEGPAEIKPPWLK